MVGTGVDYAVTNNVFLRGEYRYNDLGDNADLDQHVVKVGLGAKF